MVKNKIIQIAIVEDNIEVREYLKQLFGKYDDFNLVASYGKGNDAITFIDKHKVDVILMDIGLPDISGVDCVKIIKGKIADVEIVMHTIFDSNNNIFEALKNGASGYLLKNVSEEKIISSLRDVMQGGSPMSPVIARKVTSYFNNTSVNKEIADILTKKEYEVLNLLSKGLLYKEIAAELDTTIGTIKQYNHKIYQKLQVENKTKAINKFLGRS